MKKLISFLMIAVVWTINVHSQDSSKISVTISIPNKDVNFISKRVYDNDYLYGDLRDSISAKFRTVQEGAENTNVTLTAYIGVWLTLCDDLRRDIYAVHSNTHKRISDALKLLVAQSYLIRKLGEQDADITANIDAIKLEGRQKKRRTSN